MARRSDLTVQERADLEAIRKRCWSVDLEHRPWTGWEVRWRRKPGAPEQRVSRPGRSAALAEAKRQVAAV